MKKSATSRGREAIQSPLLWWQAPAGTVGRQVIAAARGTQQLQTGIITRNYRCAQMFEGSSFMHGGRYSPNVMSGSGTITNGTGAGSMGAGSRKGPQYNLVYELVTTVRSMILAPGGAEAMFLPDHGNWEQQQRAKLLNQFNEGIDDQTNAEVEDEKALTDALVFGTGASKVDHDPVTLDIIERRVWPGCLWTEMFDGRDERPRCLYQIDLIDKDLLKARYPAKADEIEKASALNTTGFVSDLYHSRQMPFYEAWRLPTHGKHGKVESSGDGRHVLAIDGCTIVDEDWDDDDFPFSFIRYERRTTGFYGRGLGELLYGHQTTLSRVEFAEAHAWSQFALPRLYLNIAAKMNRNHVNSSRSGAILEGMGPAGDAVQVLNWSATHPNFVAFKEWIISSAHEFCGVSEFAASGNKPAGLDSAPSQREYADIQQNRQSQFSANWGRFKCDKAKRRIALGARIWSKKGYEVKVIGKDFVKKIDWADCYMPDDEYVIQAFPVSGLPRTPAGRLAAVQEMMQSQLVTREEGLKLLQLPDTDEIMDRENAQEDYAEWLVYQMLSEGKPMPVDSLPNIDLCIDTVQKEATKAIVQGAPPERVDLLRNWMVRAKQFKDKAAAAATAQAAAQQAALQPPAPPGAPVPGGLPAPPLAKGAPLPVNPALPLGANAGPH